jgi:hypothetical protein
LDMLHHVYEFRRGELDAEVSPVLFPWAFLTFLKDDFIQLIINCLAPPPWDLENRPSLRHISNPVSLWCKFVDGIVIPDGLHDIIGQEIQSSLDWQSSSPTYMRHFDALL